MARSIKEEGGKMDEKVRENRLRRMATRQGFRLVKSRRRDPYAHDYGACWLINETTNATVTDSRGVSLDAIEAYLTSRPRPTGEQW